MDDLGKNLKDLFEEMVAEVGEARPLRRSAKRSAGLRRGAALFVAAAGVVAFIAAGAAVAGRTTGHGPSAGVAGEPTAEPSPTGSTGEDRDRPPTVETSPLDAVVTMSSFHGQDYEVTAWSFEDQICFEVSFDRSSDDSSATCFASDPSEHQLNYSEAEVPGTDYVLVFGGVADSADAVRIQLSDGRTFYPAVSDEEDLAFGYFGEFIETGGAATLEGTVQALDADGNVIEEGELCARHTWARNGESLCGGGQPQE